MLAILMPKVDEEIRESFDRICKIARLNTKERRLWAYMLNDENSLVIGDICRALHTTPFTLLAKTKPGLDNKLKAIGWRDT